MKAKINFFPVDNGDMTLIILENGMTILIDANIRATDEPSGPTYDVAQGLRSLLKQDEQKRLYVDVFLLSHPDKDHCSGLNKHFHLGKPEDHAGDKIFIHEIWSSPLIFRRASKSQPLCPDAKQFNTEAKRRVARYRESGLAVSDGDRIQILGHDEDGKTEGLSEILVKVGGLVQKVNGRHNTGMSARLLAPLPESDIANTEATLTKNDSSVILQFRLEAFGKVCYFLTGGDAGVATWEHLWKQHQNDGSLEYHLLLCPHHCSWRSLSRDSWSELGKEAKVNENARNALSQALGGANIVASSKPIKDDNSNPPCIGAKQEYEDIVRNVSGEFHCTGEYPSEGKPSPMIYEIGQAGLVLLSASIATFASSSDRALGREPLPHG